MAGRYASDTSVSVAKSQFEIKELVTKYGAVSFQLGETVDRAAVMFDMKERRVKFMLPLPSRNDKQFIRTPGRGLARTPDQQIAAWEQACRSRWRALLLCIKAKLEAVAVGITEFDNEFMAHIVLPDGLTVGEHMRPQIARAYEDGSMPPMLEGPR